MQQSDMWVSTEDFLERINSVIRYRWISSNFENVVGGEYHLPLRSVPGLIEAHREQQDVEDQS